MWDSLLATSLAKSTVGRVRYYAEKTVWLLCRLLNIVRVGLNNAASSRILVNPAVIAVL